MSKESPENIRLAESLLSDLHRFQELKESRWEQVESSVQMSNRLGTPTEDWIIPPDEDAVLHILEEDVDYIGLRKSIKEKTAQLKSLAVKLGLDTHHKLDWLKFTDPLVGTEALSDAIDCVNQIIESLKK